ncbi:MAG: substrate-binding domain-containing protein [Lentisphaeria bacterium]|nr:substrate-binding domain-containing protein [Lentisphaeria bacterium]
MKPIHKLKHILLLLRWYDYRTHRGVAQVAQEAGWHLICPKGAEDSRRILQGWQGDGCISVFDMPEPLEFFHSQNIPVVDLGLAELNIQLPRVATDNWEIGRLAAEHFLDRGYREVLALSHQGVPIFKERQASLRQHMQEKGGKVTILHGDLDHWSGLFQQLEDVATERGQRLEEMSVGFFAYEDCRAAELISLCLENGLRVPENVAVLGVDNDELINDGLAVGLSSIDTDLEGLGRVGANLLRKLLEYPDSVDPDTIIRHPPKELVVRKSTDCYAVRSPLVAKALHWIHNNYHRGIQARDIAAALGVTQQGLQKAFATSHIRSPAEDIRYQRSQAVRHYLCHTTDRLDDMAIACGFSSVDALIRNFREFYKVTPGQYRKKQNQLRWSSLSGGCR